MSATQDTTLMSLFRNPPDVKYADTGDGFVAYQVFGEGPVDLVFTTAADTHALAMWEHPAVARYFDRLASFSRVLTFDWRGLGASDAILGGGRATVETYTDDLNAAMREAGFDRAFMIGDREAGPGMIMYAAAHPNRVSGLILVNSFARFRRDDDYPIGMPDEAVEHLADWIRERWGSSDYFLTTAPGIESDAHLREWLGRLLKYSSSPGAAEVIYEFQTRIDVRDVLAAVQAPTLVITRTEAAYHRPAFGRYLAEHITGASLVEIPGADTAPFYVGHVEPVLDEIERFVTGTTSNPLRDRTLATVMFTDIVGSTEVAASMGDEAWLDTLAGLDRSLRGHIEHYRGHMVKGTGDGLLATFDGPTRATTCGAVLVDAAARLGIDIRVGLHTGEIETMGDGDIGGLAVHIAARVMDTRSGPGVTVSSTVKDLVVGSGIEFRPSGEQQLRGVPGTWRLFELVAG